MVLALRVPTTWHPRGETTRTTQRDALRATVTTLWARFRTRASNTHPMWGGATGESKARRTAGRYSMATIRSATARIWARTLHRDRGIDSCGSTETASSMTLTET